MNENFWHCLDQLVASSRVTIDRPRGSVHPRFEDIVYPLDYGFLENTSASDGAGIDVFVGSLEPVVTGVVMTVDLHKRDVEMKVLIGCSSEEMRVVHGFMNSESFGGALLVRESLERVWSVWTPQELEADEAYWRERELEKRAMLEVVNTRRRNEEF